MQGSEVPLYLHAEFLPNIRQLTLYVSLPGTAEFDGISPDCQLSQSRKAVTVSLPQPFQNVTETIKLPARVCDASRRALQTTSRPTPQTNKDSYDFSFRMQVDANDEVLAPQDESIDNFVPWTADGMSGLTRIKCRDCGQHFLESSSADSVKDGSDKNPQTWTWKDLPSGNWAEMMDFWHCHKPDPHEGHEKDEKKSALQTEEQTAQIKGYGADSQVVATPGAILVDVATFLLAESDCVGLEKVRPSHVYPLVTTFHSFFSFRSAAPSSHIPRATQKGTTQFSVGWPPILLPEMNSESTLRAQF